MYLSTIVRKKYVTLCKLTKNFSTKNAIGFLNSNFIFLITLTIGDLVIETLWRLYSITDMQWQFSKKHQDQAINNVQESSL